MKSLLILFIILFTVPTLLFSQDTLKQNKSNHESPYEIIGISKVEFSKELSHVTGLAINPLLIGGGMGAYRYFSASSNQRIHLPFYASPFFWIPAILISIIFMLGSMIHIGKPIKLILNKASAVFVAVPIIISQFSNVTNSSTLNLHYLFSPIVGTNMLCFIPFPSPSIAQLLLLPLFIITFFFVWLMMESLNTLKLLSPHFLIDWVIHFIKYTIFVTIMLATIISPTLSLFLCIILILISIKVSGWCFRINVFGTVFAWDIFTFSNKRNYNKKSRLLTFSAQKIRRVPKRTIGSITKLSSDALQFSYRPWLIFPMHSITIQTTNLILEKGIVFPSLFEGEQNKRLFDFPPRFRAHETSIAKQLDITEIRDCFTRRGLKAAGKWIRDLFSSNREKESYADNWNI